MRLRLCFLLCCFLLLIAFHCLLWCPSRAAGTVFFVKGEVARSPGASDYSGARPDGTPWVGELARVVSDAPDSSTIVVEGHHWLSPLAYVDSTCGNCEDPGTPVRATVGLVVKGVGKRIVGISPEKSVIHTAAGYGVLFEGCVACAIESLTVTDGERDPDPNATDAAIVVKNSSVRVAHNKLAGNIGDSSTVRQTVVGIMGVTGREGSAVTIENNEIVQNSWDGIALYRGASATIEENVIDGIDRARGETVGGGRGVGVGLTWNSTATVRRNLVRRYWKGIGIFVDARALVEANVVEDVATWGISLWDADKGNAHAQIKRNVVFRTGACGAAIVSGVEEAKGDPRTQELPGGEAPAKSPGRSDVAVSVVVRPPTPSDADPEKDNFESSSFVQNTLVMTGQNPAYDGGEPYCYQQALALHKRPPGFEEEGTLFFSNRESGGRPGADDIKRHDFLARIAELEGELRACVATRRSEFLKWLDAEKTK